MTVPNISPDAGALAPRPKAAVARRVGAELKVGAPVALACALLGVVMGLLWVWIAPEVPLIVQGHQVLYVDPEGEQRAGADSVFALLGAGIGIVTAVAAFLATRRRGGGIAVAVGLAVGGLVGSVVAWKLGITLGPTSDVVGHAKQVGDGHTFNEALALGAKGALLVWSMSAMVVLLGLSAAFGKREEEPPPYWAEPQQLPPADGSDVEAPPVIEASEDAK
ncbi:uncharacterized protein YqgC (DUF456 family) [Kitasatospora sp. MAP12-15]|uniref:hypothetical protein n=1 Tax=unclassified Kitasatospora TaxID=2633591 RepID=UPI002473A0F2|nr:hypothetical protein [Kitasatospora sp. MAP12-44]MDH6109976.1 uncharacterized protein YqgC (DUF456 family) [Kitasatospora sp. MAP12-44]